MLENQRVVMQNADTRDLKLNIASSSIHNEGIAEESIISMITWKSYWESIAKWQN